MGYFSIYQSNNILSKKDVKLWRFPLLDNEFDSLTETIKYSNEFNLDPRDATLYYAEWWRRNYNGGKPSKESIFESITGNIQFILDAQRFYKLARKGAEMLGIKWITKQNTLYFRTLLLQGGLPLNHISENKSNYKNFLLAVLEEQPEKIEDFIFQPYITNLLPPSSRNDIIFENCFEIVQSILNNENYYEQLFASNETIKEITDTLKIKKKTLEKKVRFLKPQNYWLLDTSKNKISLRLGFADKYTEESLSHVFGFDINKKTYQFYLNDELVCTFRKMLNNSYKTDWHNQFKQDWNEDHQLPTAYVIAEDEKIEVRDFIQIAPNLDKPTLWSPFSDNVWRLIKGNGVSTDKALLIFPNNWISENESVFVNLYDKTLSLLEFEGDELLISKEKNEERCFKTKVSSFDWTIVSQKPNWISRSNLPIVREKFSVLVYDEKNQLVTKDDYEIFYRYRASHQQWQKLSEINHLPIGCLDIKIIKDDIVAYDTCYNISHLNIVFSNQTINSAIITVTNNQFNFRLEEDPLTTIKKQNNDFLIHLNQESFKIPRSIKATLKIGTSKSLHFDLNAPFKGVELLDNDGKIIDEEKTLTFKNLHGLRILTPKNSNTIIKIQNELRSEVVILKECKISSQPLISFKDELLRLYYLVDAMDYRNRVKIELSCDNQTKTFYITGFTHFLDITEQLSKTVQLYDSDDILELFAVPLNCTHEEIHLNPLHFKDGQYIIPDCDSTQQFIIISSKDSNTQMMPRFVNTDIHFVGTDKNERIEKYCQVLENSDFTSDCWNELLAYFNICFNQNLPFSTFDQIRSISRNSKVAAKAFFYLGVNQFDVDEYIQKSIPEIEKDLGICFHWIKKEEWSQSINAICKFIGDAHFEYVVALFSKYMCENELLEVLQYLNNQKIIAQKIYNPFINEVRSGLGERVLKELPEMKPKITNYYNVPDNDYGKFSLLIKAPIAVAESIKNVQEEFPIWGGNDFRDQIRRNIQYAQYLSPHFYSKIILQVLSQN